jgi:hypothetical protein
MAAFCAPPTQTHTTSGSDSRGPGLRRARACVAVIAVTALAGRPIWSQATSCNRRRAAGISLVAGMHLLVTFAGFPIGAFLLLQETPELGNCLSAQWPHGPPWSRLTLLGAGSLLRPTVGPSVRPFCCNWIEHIASNDGFRHCRRRRR